MVSPEKQSHIKKTVAYHMGELRRGFESGDLNEELLCNMDETHFLINCNNGRTLVFRGDKEIKYADVVSGDIAMTMMVYITRGSRARIGAPMMIFQNQTDHTLLMAFQTMSLVLHIDLGLKDRMIKRLVSHAS